jgi:hypothetical protein
VSDAYRDVIAGMGRDVYDRMLAALETGRWPDGRDVTPEQREHTMQAVIAWGEAHLPADQRVGFIDRGHKAGDSCDDPQPLNWTDNR